MITLTILAPPGDGSMVTVSVSGAAAGKNGTYYLGGGMITMQLFTAPNSWQLGAWKEQIPTNIGWVSDAPNSSNPGHAVFLEYDKNNQLIPGQCVKVINSPNSYFTMQVVLNSGGTRMSPGQAAYFTTSSNVGDIVFTSTTPCSSGSSSM